MNEIQKKKHNATLRAFRVRSTVVGTTERPRLSVTISNRHISAQIIDDSTGKTITAVSTLKAATPKATMTEKAAWVGGEVAKAAKGKKITKVVFDRGSKLYHGRMKALAEAARAGGLEF